MTPFTEQFGQFVSSGDSIAAESDDFDLLATVQHDLHMGEPWKEHDGHGQVSEWTTRGKRPGELVLCSDSGSHRYYDFRAAKKTALADGWNCKPYDIAGETPRQRAARAARHDYEVLRAWCNDEWTWCGVIVTASRAGIELGCASLWGIECNYPDSDNSYLRDVANELSGEAIENAQDAIKRINQTAAA
jgi:hypothetical protein